MVAADAGRRAPPRPTSLVLEPLRLDAGEPTRPAGAAPYLAPGEVVTYRYGYFAAPLRVVRDDERGLVAWLPRDRSSWPRRRATVVDCATARSPTGRGSSSSVTSSWS